MRRPDVFDAMMQCSGTTFSIFSKSVTFASSFSMFASMTRSEAVYVSRESSRLPWVL